VAVLKGLKVDDLNEGEDTLDGYVSVDHGMEPLLAGYGSDSEELSALAQWVKELPSDSIRDSEIGILAFTNKQLAAIEESLSAQGITTLLLSSDKADDRSEEGVRLCTMHRAKGLEFKAVAIPFMSASLFPPEWLLSKAVDAADREDIEAQLKSLLHVAATRAKGHLRVSWSGDVSPFINHVAGI
jgi:superfamily I DNA/RNA helicase